ncbi:MAG: hypothetical protein ACXVRH_01305 [Thermoleophilaceae bacterium]
MASSSSNRPKTKLQVSVVKVQSFQPGFLQRGLVGNGKLVGVQLTVKNVGFATWSGSPAADAALITSRNKQAPGMTVGGGCVGGFATRAELSPGEVQHGCVAFVLHRGEKPKLFQFSPDFPATPPAEWRLS